VLQHESEHMLKLVVEDDGKGCPEDAAEGLGSRIVRLLPSSSAARSGAKGQIPDAGCR
jgi:two-component sensor histidine kinase